MWLSVLKGKLFTTTALFWSDTPLTFSQSYQFFLNRHVIQPQIQYSRHLTLLVLIPPSVLCILWPLMHTVCTIVKLYQPLKFNHRVIQRPK